MRRTICLLILGFLAGAPVAALAAEPKGPVVDVVEIAGIIDRPIARYAIERIDAAERDGDALVVFEVDSLGGLKVSDDRDLLPPLVRRIRDSRVPIAVHVGPRTARAAGMIAFMGEAAHVFSMGPSTHVGPATPVDLGRVGRATRAHEATAFTSLAQARGRATSFLASSLGASEALKAHVVDLVAPSVADLLQTIGGRTVSTAAGSVTLSLPKDQTTVRFHQPGPIRRLLHTFSNPTLVYIMLLAGAVLVVFELFQPGFGVAGVTGGLLLAASVYGLTVLPGRALGISLLAAGLLLLTLDVALDALALPTILGAVLSVAGSLTLYPNSAEPVRLAPWLVGAGIGSALIFFVPVMTMVRRARTPVTVREQRPLVGLGGEVRSMLNPEGFVMVADQLWRARSESGTRMRVGEPVVVSQIDGTVLIVRAPEPAANGTPAGLA